MITGNLAPTRNVGSHFQEHSNTAVHKMFWIGGFIFLYPPLQRQGWFSTEWVNSLLSVICTECKKWKFIFYAYFIVATADLFHMKSAKGGSD